MQNFRSSVGIVTNLNINILMNIIRHFKKLLRFPATLLIFIVIIFSFSFFLIWFRPSFNMTMVGILVSFILVLIWPLFLMESGNFADILAPLTNEAETIRRQRLEDLRTDLTRVNAHQGISQLDLLDQKLAGLIEVLKRRLNAGELTLLHYFDAAEQVYLSAIDNLHEIYVALTSVGTIDRERIDQRLSELRIHGNKAAAAVSEIDSLSQRRTMLEQQTSKVETLFAQNEQAMTTLDHAATALADARINKGQASVDIDSALLELESLARRAGNYARRTSK